MVRSAALRAVPMVRSAALRAVPMVRSAALRSQTQLPSDQQQLHLGGALADFQNLAVAIVPGDGIVVHEPVAAEYLGGVAGIVHCRLAGDQFGDRRLLLEGLARQ